VEGVLFCCVGKLPRNLSFPKMAKCQSRTDERRSLSKSGLDFMRTDSLIHYFQNELAGASGCQSLPWIRFHFDVSDTLHPILPTMLQ
jgi:hypothetical protein